MSQRRRDRCGDRLGRGEGADEAGPMVKWAGEAFPKAFERLAMKQNGQEKKHVGRAQKVERRLENVRLERSGSRFCEKSSVFGLAFRFAHFAVLRNANAR